MSSVSTSIPVAASIEIIDRRDFTGMLCRSVRTIAERTRIPRWERPPELLWIVARPARLISEIINTVHSAGLHL